MDEIDKERSDDLALELYSIFQFHPQTLKVHFFHLSPFKIESNKPTILYLDPV